MRVDHTGRVGGTGESVRVCHTESVEVPVCVDPRVGSYYTF